jgi:hypothetical protein
MIAFDGTVIASEAKQSRPQPLIPGSPRPLRGLAMTLTIPTQAIML